jgi:competence ComEA-like helix-hairpin-helix protein
MGGFTSVEQVKKTYGLSDSAYAAILPYLSLSPDKSNNKTTIATTSSKKININTASVNELKSNAAIPSEVAEAIVIYRKQHGSYSSVEDVKKIVFINDEIYQKIAPYLSVD